MNEVFIQRDKDKEKEHIYSRRGRNMSYLWTMMKKHVVFMDEEEKDFIFMESKERDHIYGRIIIQFKVFHNKKNKF